MAALPVPQKLHSFTTARTSGPERLREALARALPELSTRHLVLIVKNGLVQVNGEAAEDLDAPVAPGSQLQVDLRHGLRGQGTPKRKTLVEQIRVLHDDADLVVVAKAAGVVVQPSELETGPGAPVVELLKHYWKVKKQPIVNPILVQRLDKLTSGLLVLAKTAQAGKTLQRQLTSRAAERRYLAVVAGKLELEKGTWHNLIGPGDGGMRRVLGPAPTDPDAERPAGAQEAITHFHVKERLRGATLIEARLATGRTHQIRIHCAAAGHVVLGDPVYVKTLSAEKRRKVPECPRLMLHATHLKFQHPTQSTRWLTFRDDPPADFMEIVESYRFRD